MDKTVLIVDDNEDLVQILGARLEAGGYRVLMALNGEEGIAKAEAEQPNLVLLDVMMPGMDGFEVLRRLKESERACQIPVVMLTARGETKLIFKAEELGAADYIVKPCDGADLLRHVVRHIGEAS
jgi:DNA-binding response OmpR family regulator